MFILVPVIAHGAAELTPGEMRTVYLGDRAVLLVNLEGTFHALDDTCTHGECSLGEGYLDGAIVACPCHGATFDVCTGAALTLPATVPVCVYPVRVTSATDLQIDLPS